jgi:hypothetical protein
LAILVTASLALTTVYLQARGRDAVRDQPLEVVHSYLKATYAREFHKAYDYLSSADQSVRDKDSYVRAQGEFTGFTRKVARKLADLMALEVMEHIAAGERSKIKVAYAVPAPGDVSSLLFEWDSEKLNALSLKEQQGLLDNLKERKKAGKLVMLQGQETFELVREGKTWRIFQDWAAGVKIQIHTAVPSGSQIDVKLSQKEVITKGAEPFQVHLKIKNRGSDTVVVSMRHILEPAEAAEDLEIIQCGLLRPVPLRPEIEQEFSMAYLLSEATRQKVRDLTLTYALEVNK